MITLKNLFLGLKEQGPLKRAFRNFFIAWGLFSKYSHIRKDGVSKISYKHKESAIKAAQNMEKKNGVHYSVYKCIYCDGYHIGRNRDNR